MICMRRGKTLIALLLAAAMAFALAGCGKRGVTAEDATNLVQGNLDEIYLGVFDPDFLKSVNITESQAEETYRGGLETETEYFIYYYGLEEVSDELYQEIVDLHADIYSYSSYTVQPATEQSDGSYAVKVTFRPLDIHVQVDEEWADFMTAFNDDYADVDVDSMTDEEYAAFWSEYSDDYNRRVVDLVKSKLPTMGYGEEDSLVIQVILDDDGYYTMDETSFQMFDTMLLTYP